MKLRKLKVELKTNWYYYIMPSLFEVFMVFLFAFHLKFPMEKSYMLWQHVVLGSLDIKYHKIVTNNPFSYLPSRSLRRSSWLSDDLIYLLFKGGRYKTLIVLKVFLLMVMVTVPMYLFKLDTFIYTFIAPLYLLLIMPVASLRPNLFALFMFFLFHIAYRYKKPLFMGIVVFFWSLIHGSYIIGTIGLLLKFSENINDVKNKRYLTKWSVGILLSIVPLFLYHSSLQIFLNLSAQKYILRTFNEWLSPDFKGFFGILLFLYMLLWVISVKYSKNNEGFWTGAFLLFMSLYAWRFMPFFAIFATVDIAEKLPVILEGGFKDYIIKTTRRPFWLFSFFLFFIFNAPGFNYFAKEYHPFGCEKYIMKYPAGTRILSIQAWVPYLFYSTGGKYKFAVDATLSQTDSVLILYKDFLEGIGCCESIKKLEPDIVVLPRRYYEKLKGCCGGCLKIEHLDTVCVIGYIEHFNSKKSY